MNVVDKLNAVQFQSTIIIESVYVEDYLNKIIWAVQMPYFLIIVHKFLKYFRQELSRHFILSFNITESQNSGQQHKRKTYILV